MMRAAKKLVGGAVGALSVARDVAVHAAWYVRYQVDGTARDEENSPAEPSDSD